MRSPTLGEVSMNEIASKITEYINAAPDKSYEIVVGTDSQNFDHTKIVVVVAVHNLGNGGIFFYEVSHIPLIKNLQQKLYEETSRSLACAQALLDQFDALGYDIGQKAHFSIHVDVGENGKSAEYIAPIVGWVKACGYDVAIKPDSYAASGIANKSANK